MERKSKTQTLREALAKIEIDCNGCKHKSPTWECVYPSKVCEQYLDKQIQVLHSQGMVLLSDDQTWPEISDWIGEQEKASVKDHYRYAQVRGFKRVEPLELEGKE